MAETWFRGEGAGVAPAAAGKMTHDFVDGVYFADTLDGAKPFAGRALDPKDQRLYKVNIDMGSMRVLNLTADPRWVKYMNEPLSPAGGMSRMTFLKQMPSAEHYNSFFNGFLKANKIDLSHYDAVAGPLIQHGGNQLCIMHKNGVPSTIATKLRGQFVPVGGTPVPASPPGTLRLGGKIGPGLKVAGGTLIQFGVTVLLHWLLGKWKDKVNQQRMEQQMSALQPKIEADIKAQKGQVLFIMSEGRKAFAKIRVAAVTERTMDIAQGSEGWDESPPNLLYKELSITDTELKKEDAEDGSDVQAPAIGSRTRTDFYKFTVPLTCSEEELNLFRSYMKEMNWYKSELAKGHSDEDTRRLARELESLSAKLNAAMTE